MCLARAWQQQPNPPAKKGERIRGFPAGGCCWDETKIGARTRRAAQAERPRTPSGQLAAFVVEQACTAQNMSGNWGGLSFC